MEYDRHTNEPLSEYDVKLFNDCQDITSHRIRSALNGPVGCVYLFPFFCLIRLECLRGQSCNGLGDCLGQFSAGRLWGCRSR